jgi:hypothetical protein
MHRAAEPGLRPRSGPSRITKPAARPKIVRLVLLVFRGKVRAGLGMNESSCSKPFIQHGL